MKGLEYPFRGNDTKHFKTPVYISYTFNRGGTMDITPKSKTETNIRSNKNT